MACPAGRVGRRGVRNPGSPGPVRPRRQPTRRRRAVHRRRHRHRDCCGNGRPSDRQRRDVSRIDAVEGRTRFRIDGGRVLSVSIVEVEDIAGVRSVERAQVTHGVCPLNPSGLNVPRRVQAGATRSPPQAAACLLWHGVSMGSGARRPNGVAWRRRLWRRSSPQTLGVRLGSRHAVAERQAGKTDVGTAHEPCLGEGAVAARVCHFERSPAAMVDRSLAHLRRFELEATSACSQVVCSFRSGVADVARTDEISPRTPSGSPGLPSPAACRTRSGARCMSGP